jgi:hypothetical protein
MKLWRGKKRIAKKLSPQIFNKIFEKEYKYFINLKPGDLYFGCDGFNHRLAKKEIGYWSIKSTRVVESIRLIGEDNSIHVFPTCAYFPRVKKEIIKSWLCRASNPEGISQAKEWGWSNFLTKLTAGEELLDDDGVLLDSNWMDEEEVR